MTKTIYILGLTLILTAFLIQIPGTAQAGQTNLYVANEGGGTISEYSQTGTSLGNFATGLNSPAFLAKNSSGDIYVSNSGSVQEYSSQGMLLLNVATSFTPGSVVITSTGNLLVGNYFGGSIYEYSSTGQSLGPFSNPGLVRADFMTLDSQGNLYVTDFMSGVVEKISSAGVDEGKFLTNVQGIEGIKFDSSGNLYAAFESQFSYNGTDMIRKYSALGQDLGLITSTGLSRPYGITFGPDGNLYVANAGNNTIHEFSSTGTDLGVFASTGMNQPRDLVFSSVVPEPTSLLLTLVGFFVIFGIVATSQVRLSLNMWGRLKPADPISPAG